MARAGQLILKNLALTAVVLVACILLAYVASWAANEVFYGPGAESPRHAGAMTIWERAELRQSLRDAYANVAVWVGLAISQAVFLVWHLEPVARTGGAAGRGDDERDRLGGV